jgi:tetratricopeptide (TPR) repeat protein
MSSRIEQSPRLCLRFGLKTILGTLAAVLFFGLLELTLWLLPGFEPVPVVQAFGTPDSGHWTIDPAYTRFVLGRDNVKVDHQTWIPQNREPGEIGVVFLGESAAAGYPATDFSLARLVRVLWNDRHPDRRMQTANFTSVGINTHVLRVWAREAAKLRPDAVVVYAGNNEAIGPYGPAAVWGRQSPSTFIAQASLAVRNTRTGLALTRLLDFLSPAETEAKSWQSLNEFKDAKMPADSPVVSRMAAQTRDNFQAIIDTSVASEAKVLLCTPAVNLADWPPLASEQEAEKSAEATFGRAQEAASDGRREEALALYRQARDLDLMRLRADSHVREAVISAARETGKSSVALLDSDRRLHEENPGPLGDRELFLEHVHLTFEARVALAEMIINELEVMLLRQERRVESPEDWWLQFPAKLARAEEILFFTDFDRMDMAYAMERLLGMEIFRGSPWLAGRRANFASQAAELSDKTRREWDVARVRGAYAKAKASPGCDDLVHSTAGQLFEMVDAGDEAVAAYQEALRLRPNNVTARVVLAREALVRNDLEQTSQLLDVDYLDPQARGFAAVKGELLAKRGQFAEAEPWLRMAARDKPDDPILLRNLASVQQQAGLTEEAIGNYRILGQTSPDDAYVLNNLAWLLVDGRNADKTEKAEALNASRRAVGLKPAEANFWGTYATVLAANAMQVEARTAAAKAADLARQQDKPATIDAMKIFLESASD